jgi:hypothetical protein
MIKEEFLKLGKTRGYQDTVYIDSVAYWVKFAIKKLASDSYKTFYFIMEESKICTNDDDIYDSCKGERFFQTFADATAYLISKGANLDKFGPFKGSGPPI